MPWLDNLLGRDRSLLSTQQRYPTAFAAADEAAAFCLEQLMADMRADAGHAYLSTGTDGQFRLTTARGEAGQAPVVLDRSEIPAQAAVVERAGDRWLTVPCGPLMVLRVKLVRGATPPAPHVRRSEAAAALVETARQLEEARQELEQLKAVLTASRLSGEVALKSHRALELLFHIPLRILGAADGGLVLQGRAGEGPSLAASAGRGAILTVKLLGGAAPALLGMPERPDLVSGPALGALRSEGVQAVTRIPALLPGPEGRPAGCAYYFLQEATEAAARRVATFAGLSSHAGRIVAESGVIAQTADLYVDTLKSLVAGMDGANLYTVGHSERMLQYAEMTARELGLQEDHVQAVGLGAYLHDIGMIAVDTATYAKDGRLTSREYELIQEHTRIGSELVSPVQSVVPLGPMVAHHHERWDGRGYPARMKGKDIPLGARIIAVADLFDAKTTGRAYRKPLPLDRALADLQALAGTQLDPAVVAAFTLAFHKLRRPAQPGKPIMRCWELRQIPAAICGACPNRAAHVRPCWESPGEACSAHGDACATCLVYTETLSRGVLEQPVKPRP
ncbi:MAG TPA: HD domain-containing phosphohydrolase [Symbiobacteriaceae bacterium]|nr:HD domain-containing phosphohydrolase [Symbiobacteriaceae bacterium]